MKYILIVLFLFLVAYGSSQQKPDYPKGTVNYITSQTVYVKFTSTTGINAGDTLFRQTDGNTVPCLVVKSLSSTSAACATIPGSGYQPAVLDEIVSLKTGKQVRVAGDKSEPTKIPVPVTPEADISNAGKPTEKTAVDKKKPTVDGSMSAYMNTTFSEGKDQNSMRLKYGLNLRALNLANGRLNIETYLTAIYKTGQWKPEGSDLFNNLKIYNLSASYTLSEKTTIRFGRKINPKLGSMGAVDGLQLEHRFGAFSAGVLAGSRPDYQNYGFDFSLFQYGVYVAHDKQVKNGNIQTTMALINQDNSGKTDRRYLYLQHFNTLAKNLYLFASIDIDIFSKSYNVSDSTYQQDNQPQLTNLNTSLRYRFSRRLSASFSYTSRKQVIYYESYKSYLDRLLDDEHLQGYSVQVITNPLKKITLGVTGSYRFQESDPDPTTNLHTYLTYQFLPVIGWSSTASATLLKTAFFSGNIYSLGFTGNIYQSKVSGGINYRNVKYDYSEIALNQDILEMNVLWRIYSKFTLSAFYEGCFAEMNDYTRLYLQLRLGF